MFVPTLALLLVGCGSAATAHDRGAELAACELISSSGDELARCLVMKYDWPADTAGPAKYAWQGHLDSLQRDHEAQAAAVLARVAQEEARAAAAQHAARMRQAAAWVACVRAHPDIVNGRVVEMDELRRQWQPCIRKLPPFDVLDAYFDSQRLNETDRGWLEWAEQTIVTWQADSILNAAKR